jgi:DNA repair protein RadC
VSSGGPVDTDHGNIGALVVADPIPETSPLGCPVVADAVPAPDAVGCVPWIKVVRDPELFSKCLAVARSIVGPRDVYDLLHEHLAKEDQEVALVVVTDVKASLIGVAEVHRGARAEVSVSMTDIFRPVLCAAGSHAFILCHGHPSGSAKPSPADEALTKAVREIADKFKPHLSFLDHVIIGRGEFYSFNDGVITKL